jgi:hypothetical protein
VLVEIKFEVDDDDSKVEKYDVDEDNVVEESVLGPITDTFLVSLTAKGNKNSLLLAKQVNDVIFSNNPSVLSSRNII